MAHAVIKIRRPIRHPQQKKLLLIIMDEKRPPISKETALISNEPCPISIDQTAALLQQWFIIAYFWKHSNSRVRGAIWLWSLAPLSFGPFVGNPGTTRSFRAWGMAAPLFFSCYESINSPSSWEIDIEIVWDIIQVLCCKVNI